MATLVHRGLSPLRRSLRNGATVLVQQTATHPAVTLYATLPCGSGFDEDQLLGRSNFLARVIDRGTRHRTADQLAEDLDGRGVSLNVGVTRHLLSLSCTCLGEDLQAMLDIFADVLRYPTFPPGSDRAAPRHDHHGHSAGRRQPGCRGDGRADATRLSRRPSVRPTRPGHGRIRRAHYSRRSRPPVQRTGRSKRSAARDRR